MSYERRPIPGFPGYFADIDGVIWSQWSRGLGGLKTEPHRLMGSPDNLKGYLRVAVKTAVAKFSVRRVHVLIAATFIGPRPDGLVVRHIDGDHLNNRPSNLAYGTYADNSRDTAEHGRKVSGERVGTSKLTAAQVGEIRRRLAQPHTLTAIGADFGVDHKTISSIRDGRTWRNV